MAVYHVQGNSFCLTATVTGHDTSEAKDSHEYSRYIVTCQYATEPANLAVKWEVRFRYSEMVGLVNELKNDDVALPPLSAKHFWTKMNAEVVPERSAAIDRVLEDAVRAHAQHCDVQDFLHIELGKELAAKVASGERLDKHPKSVNATLTKAMDAEAARWLSTVNWAVTSTAHTTKMMPAFKGNALCSVVMIASRDKTMSEAIAKELTMGTPRERARRTARQLSKGITYEELFADEMGNFDSCYVPISTAHRGAVLKKMAAGGKHIYSAVPIGGTVGELKTILDVCAANKCLWMDGTAWYHSARTKEIEKLLRAKKLGEIKKVAASTFEVEGWLAGDDASSGGGGSGSGGGGSGKVREPMGCFRSQGWYPLSVILWAYDYELPEKVEMTHTEVDSVGTIILCRGTLSFKGGRKGMFQCGIEHEHRSQYEIECEKGSIKVDDRVAGDVDPYFGPYTAGSSYVLGDEVTEAGTTDHAACKVADFVDEVNLIRGGSAPNAEWSRRSLAVHITMCALSESVAGGGAAAAPATPTRSVL